MPLATNVVAEDIFIVGKRCQIIGNEDHDIYLWQLFLMGAGDNTLDWMKANWKWAKLWIYHIGLFLTTDNNVESSENAQRLEKKQAFREEN